MPCGARMARLGAIVRSAGSRGEKGRPERMQSAGGKSRSLIRATRLALDAQTACTRPKFRIKRDILCSRTIVLLLFALLEQQPARRRQVVRPVQINMRWRWDQYGQSLSSKEGSRGNSSRARNPVALMSRTACRPQRRGVPRPKPSPHTATFRARASRQ